MKSILSAVLLGAVLTLSSTATAEDTRVYEIRTYHANEGKLDALNARFRDHTVALFKKHGIENIGYWVPTDNKDNLLIYVLAYPGREARDASWKAFMADPDWKAAQAASEKDGKLVNKVDSQFMTAADYSPSIKPVVESPERLFELRVYHTNDGKLAGLDSRFRDHTLKIFEDNGMQNIAYWHLMDDQAEAKTTLIYMIAFKDGAARDKSWADFGNDRNWTKAYAASISNGRLVNKVDSTQMKPTDYSPMK